MKPEIKQKVELAYYWARHEACSERGDEKMAKFWFDKFINIKVDKK